MAELSAADSVQAVASEQEVLLATKLHVPGSRPGLVPRPRLTGRLTEGLGQGLVLVCAPAGYGKTVLLAQWARQGGRPSGGYHWMRPTMIRPGSGVMRWPRWTRPVPGSASGWIRCWARRRHLRSSPW